MEVGGAQCQNGVNNQNSATPAAHCEIRGNSTDRFARPGDFLIVVDREASGLPLRSGDVVMVTQHKNGLHEVTARHYRATDRGGCELVFDSTDSHHSRWIGLPDDEGKVGVQLGGIVVGAYRPL